MAIRHQNAGKSGTKFTAVRNYHGGPTASISRFSTAPDPSKNARKGRCGAKTKAGKECNAFHTTSSNFCVNHEAAAEAAREIVEAAEVTDELAADS